MKCLLGVAVFLLLGSSVQSQATLTLDISEGSVHPGANITFVCRITGIDAGTFIYWYKAVMSTGGPQPMMNSDDVVMEENLELISISDVIQPYYDSLNGRYTATKSTIGDDTFIFTLNVYNVSHEDSGHFGCAVPNDDNAYSTKMLEVYEAPAEVYFAGHENAENMTFTEGHPRNVTCVIRHSLPTPVAAIHVGHDATSYRDVTKSFLRVTEMNVNCEEATGNDDKKCPLNVDYDVMMKSSAWEPTYKDEGRFLRCHTSYPEHYKLPQKYADILIDYRYKPKFECDPKLIVKKGATMAKIHCDVYFNPTPLDAHWEFTVSGKTYKLNSTDMDGDFKAEVHTMDENFGEEHQRGYMLTVSNLGSKHMGVSFKLVVENGLGTNSTSVKVEREVIPPPNPSGSAALTWSFVTLFATIAAILKL